MSVQIIANPIEAELLKQTLPQVLPERRLRVAAEILGCHLEIIFKAAEIPSYKAARSRAKSINLTPHIVPLAKALGVPIEALWDEQALEDPRKVICCRIVANERKKKIRVLKAVS